jgi:hypothetical protein
MVSWEELPHLSDAAVARLDQVEMNRSLAKEIPLADLDIPPYRRQADEWAAGFRRWLSSVEQEFHKRPEEWDHDIHMFRLASEAQ